MAMSNFIQQTRFNPGPKKLPKFGDAGPAPNANPSGTLYTGPVKLDIPLDKLPKFGDAGPGGGLDKPWMAGGPQFNPEPVFTLPKMPRGAWEDPWMMDGGEKGGLKPNFPQPFNPAGTGEYFGKGGPKFSGPLKNETPLRREDIRILMGTGGFDLDPQYQRPSLFGN